MARMLRDQDEQAKEISGLDVNRQRVEEDLDIMERHAAELAAVDGAVRLSMRRHEREYMDDHFHSVPAPRKHVV
ncbi:MAG: hypothetical protein A2091_04565 [Desulfuromonadales bacterium GWD2_61_12]|nr:MAG: hypothetical protein A2005_07630 [Desulfuromonadales bacterium GWC2_61_20]OGR34478.1 MAG: hypothetical protein A2091_04565 [Desulfuromonadales bacterium GWD2_61_12]HAD03863.1 hypothetical protein [Desulfuromonas sp.]HBT82864.1 hypothetical protein [Desulfuromonas sp.]